MYLGKARYSPYFRSIGTRENEPSVLKTRGWVSDYIEGIREYVSRHQQRSRRFLLLVLVPRLTANPAQLHARSRANLDAGALGGAHGFLDALHEILGVSD